MPRITDRRFKVNSPPVLLEPADCVLFLIDHQASLAVGVGSSDLEVIVTNSVALARTAAVFAIPTIVTRIEGPMDGRPTVPSIQSALADGHTIARQKLNCWEDELVREAFLKMQRRRVLVSGLLTEACVSFPVLSALAEGYEVFVVADACGGIGAESHALAMRRMEIAGARMVSWIQVLLELQRDWTREETRERARGILDSYAPGYAMALGLAEVPRKLR
jgi:nicotinamidase-related amidase